MLISNVAIRRPVFTAMVMMALITFGWVFYRDLGVDLFPRVEFPIVTIVTRLPGADPETMELLVSDPIEEAVNTIEGIKNLRSTSVESVSQVVIEFQLEKDIDVAFQEVQAKLGAIRSDLPDDIDEPVVEKFDVDAAPIMAVIVSADMPYKDLSHLADKVVKDRLERVRHVGSVKLVGQRDRKIWVWLDPERLQQHNLSTRDVTKALRREHVEYPGGRVETGTQELAAKVKAEFRTADDFDHMVVAYRGGAPIRVRDLGRTEDGLEEERTFAQLDDKPCIALLVRRQSGTNTVAVAHAVKAEIEHLRTELAPRGVRLEEAQDQSQYIEHSVAEVKFDLLYGGALAILIVLAFLLNFRSAFISALVLPTSVISTFVFMHAMGFTLNMMTLLGLSLAIGLLIDDAIVVQENISRHVQEGMPAREAAAFATSEIGLAVLATTLSVVAVFGPVALMKGIVGRFFFPFAMTVSFAVLISMFVSFTLDPTLSARLLRKKDKLNPLFALLERGFELLQDFYRGVLRVCLKHRLAVVALAVAALVASLQFAKGLRSEFVPVEDQSEFNIKVRAPLGAPLQKTRAILEACRERAAQLPEVAYTFYTIGADELQRVNEGKMYVKLVEKHQRTRSQEDIMKAVRDALVPLSPGGRGQGEGAVVPLSPGGRGQGEGAASPLSDAKISVEIVPRVSGGGMRFALVQCEIRGPDFDTLNAIAAQLMDRMRKAGGYVDLDTTFETGKPEAQVLVNRERAADMGVSPVDIGETIRASIGGVDVAKFKAEGDRYDIAVRLLESFRDKPGLIENLRVPNANGQLIELRNVAQVVTAGTPVQIDRYKRQRQITVLSNLKDKVLGEATTEIEQFTSDIGLPPGYSTGWVGFAEAMQESFGYLMFTFYLSIIVIYMVLASQFESLVHPFTIMLSLPLAIVGALAALAAFRFTINIFVMMSFIFLLGLVTKNAILLIDYTNTLRHRDAMERDTALLTAAPIRLRPILMTTLAMIAGMLPVAIGMGAGAESRRPMAIAIIGGLISSTLLTLLVVPSVYSLLDQALARFLRFLGLAERHAADTPGERT
jgi:HAE1 family hydrophobic/amphiphilic exporter-1